MARLSRQDWLNAGLAELAEGGVQGIKIDRLCKRLNISIGSFYHHFVNIDDYMEKLADGWEAYMQEHLADTLDREAAPEERLRSFHERILDMNPRLEVVVRGWSFSNEYVAKIVDKLDKKRMRMLASQFMELGFKNDEAKLLAEVEYSTYLGVLSVCANRNKQSSRKLHHLVSGMIRGKRDKVSQLSVM